MKNSKVILVIVCVLLIGAFLIVKKISQQKTMIDERTETTNLSIEVNR